MSTHTLKTKLEAIRKVQECGQSQHSVAKELGVGHERFRLYT